MRGASVGSEASEHLQRLLREDEELTWHGKPDKKALYASNAIGGLFAAVFFGGFFGIPGSAVIGGIAVGVWGEQAALWAVGGFLALLAVGIPTGLILGMRQHYENAEFAVTDDRVIETGGMIGKDTSTISLEDIRDVDVNVGLFSKLFGTGSLEFQVAGGSNSGITFNHVPSPYVTLQQIEGTRKDAEEEARTVAVRDSAT